MNNLSLLHPIFELTETTRSISLSVVVIRVGLMLVCCRFVDARTVLLLKMLNLVKSLLYHLLITFKIDYQQ